MGFPGSSAGKESTCNAGVQETQVRFLSWEVPLEQGFLGFPCGSDGKEFVCNAGDLGSIPGLGRSPGGGHGNLLQYTCLENPMSRRAWWATVHGVAKSDMTEWLSTANGCSQPSWEIGGMKVILLLLEVRTLKLERWLLLAKRLKRIFWKR